MQWFELKVSLQSADGTDAVANFIEEHIGSPSVEDPECARAQKDGWEAFDDVVFASPGAVFRVWVEENEKEEANSALQDALQGFEQEGTIKAGWRLDVAPAKDWMKLSEEAYQVQLAGERVQVVPLGKAPLPERDVVVQIDPGLGFGTGEHATTQLALCLLERHLKPGFSVCDVGTGNGVLAIAAKLLGAKSVDAFDYDASAVKQARKNAVLSEVAIDFGVADLLQGTEKRYDLVVANIVTDILLRLSETLEKAMVWPGCAILSGIAEEREEEVFQQLWSLGFSIGDIERKGGWTAVMLYRRPLPFIAEVLDLLEEYNLLASRPPIVGVVRDMHYDSRLVTPGSIFVCKGRGFDPKYAEDALERGAMAFLTEHVLENIPRNRQIVVRDVRAAMARCASVVFSNYDASHVPCLIGITGTKGKSTTIAMLEAIYKARAKKLGTKPPAVFSTVHLYDGLRDEPSTLTTPESIDLYRHLRRAQDLGIDHVLIEVSSQALKYDRVTGLIFDYGVVLNVAPDHIGPIEHPTYEDYVETKFSIFDMSGDIYMGMQIQLTDLDGNLSTSVIESVQWRQELYEPQTFSTVDSHALWYAPVYEEDGVLGLDFSNQYDEEKFLTTSLPGAYNLENALCAAVIASEDGVDLETIAEGLQNVHIEGRMLEYVGEDLTVIVDYAHNGFAFDALLSSVQKEHPDAPLWLVFGATGGKAQSRRKDLGESASRFAAQVVLTTDDAGNEDPYHIAEEIATFMNDGVPYHIEVDREKAIEWAITHAPKGAVVLLLGKGCERAQKMQDGPVPYRGDDVIAKEALDAYRPVQ